MGCQFSTSTKQYAQTNLSIIDPNFTKPSYQNIRYNMEQSKINFQSYISVNYFIQKFRINYTNQVATTVENYNQVIQQMKKMSFNPNIYVIDPKKKQQINIPDVYLMGSYSELIRKLIQKNRRKKIAIRQLLECKDSKLEYIGTKILKKNTKNQTSDEIIFQSTLKNKNISYDIYDSYQQLEQSCYDKESYFIVTDYVYHNEVISLLGQNAKTKVICYSILDDNLIFNPRTFFISNTFLEIANEIQSGLKQKDLKNVTCSKIYLYTVGLQEVKQYAKIIEQFQFQVRIVSDLQKMLKQTTYFFCVSLVIAQSQFKKVRKFLQKNEYEFKVKIIPVKIQGKISQCSMRKIIKQLKKGYFAKKGVTQSVDIIDKHFDNVKFEQIKKQLGTNSINCFGYDNIDGYIKKKKYISPFIICNYQQKQMLTRYLKQIEYNFAKIIVFCNKNKINQQLKQDKSYIFVSNHFGKIINFIKKHHVYKPHIIMDTDIQFNEKVIKFKKKNKRISALKWYGINENNLKSNDVKFQQEKFQFLNVSKDISKSAIKQIQKDAALIWKLDYNPLKKFQTFREDLAQSISNLTKLYKINYPEKQLAVLLEQIRASSITKLLKKSKQFFDSENQLGLKINQRMLDLDRMTQQQITNFKQLLFLINLNYLTIYKSPPINRYVLEHLSTQSLLQKCEVNTFLFTKNYFVLYEKDTCYQNTKIFRIIVQFDYDTITEKHPWINSFFIYKDKWIFAPYSQFLIKEIKNSEEQKTIVLEYIKNVEYLNVCIEKNMQINPSKMVDTLQEYKNSYEKTSQMNIFFDDDNNIRSRLNLQRFKGLEYFYNHQYENAIELHQKTIQQEDNLENFDLIRIGEMNYQLACFYIRSSSQKNKPNKLLKEVVQSKPSQYLARQCQKLKLLINSEGGVQKNLKKTKDKKETFVWVRQSDGDLQNPSSEPKSQEDCIKQPKFEIKSEVLNEINQNCLDLVDDELDYEEVSISSKQCSSLKRILKPL